MRAEAEATILMLDAASGGRTAPVAGCGCHYRPHVRVGSEGQHLGVCFLDGPELIAPGTTAIVKMVLVYHPEVDYSALVAGAHFLILEGPHVVETGTVIRRQENATG